MRDTGTKSFRQSYETLVRSESRHPLSHGERVGFRQPVLAREKLALIERPAKREGRIELKGPMQDLYFAVVGKRGERPLEAPLADVAPRADEVGPDLDLQI